MYWLGAKTSDLHVVRINNKINIKNEDGSIYEGELLAVFGMTRKIVNGDKMKGFFEPITGKVFSLGLMAINMVFY